MTNLTVMRLNFYHFDFIKEYNNNITHKFLFLGQQLNFYCSSKYE